ncbi:BRO1 domain [Phaffia rhodozyma]|uniref:pH-response regulator protein palC n=1 Tax=Phaffia rhodozyma TaxID=264483 RepID=A0A0F7SV06_PHARH|nr:BRO1 domain [Phaffia rhodozyma]
MATFLFPIPTTGSLAFSSFLINGSDQNLDTHLTEATNHRTALRGILKTERRTGDGEKDALAVFNAVENYLPCLISITNSLKVDDLLLGNEPVFSWRATCTQSFSPNPSRLSLSSFLAEETFVLLTYTYALANLSTSIVLSLVSTTASTFSSSSASSRAYELDLALPTAERKKKDERLGQAADLLCRAAGVAEYAAENVVGEWERDRVQRGGSGRGKGPVEGSKAFALGLSKMLLADAQLLSIRKLLAPSISSVLHIGPPLPKPHPSPSLLAKLYLNVLSLYSLSHTLILSSSSSLTSSTSSSLATDSPIDELIKYVKDGKSFAEAMSRKWLGIDAGEFGDHKRIGEAIVWLRESKKILADGSSEGRGLNASGILGGIGKGKGKGKEEKKERREKWADEEIIVESFLRAYEKANQTIYFVPIPTLSSLLSQIPTGRAVLSLKKFVPPCPTFGPGSQGYISRSGVDLEGALDKMTLRGLNQDADTGGVTSGGYY